MIYIKKLLVKTILLTLLFLTISISSYSYNFDSLQKINFPDQQPYLDENNRTLIPVRFVTETLGREVVWKNQSREVIIKNNEERIILKTGSNEAKIIKNGIETRHDIGTAAVLIDGRVMVPLRFLTETMGSEVIWDDRNKAVVINKEMVINLDSAVEKNYILTDEFDFFNYTLWRKTNHYLENTKINSKNVFVENGLLKIKLPKDKFEGGEIESRKFLGFGSYEIKMKLPDVPSSITGFFLYKSPVLHHEIDIEIYNEKERGYFLTSYFDGKKQNLYESKLNFDPTADFHIYRIDYGPNSIKFYADGVLLKEWNEGYTKERMQLMVNTWYPDWLERQPADNTAYLEIDWIRY